MSSVTLTAARHSTTCLLCSTECCAARRGLHIGLGVSPLIVAGSRGCVAGRRRATPAVLMARASVGSARAPRADVPGDRRGASGTVPRHTGRSGRPCIVPFALTSRCDQDRARRARSPGHPGGSSGHLGWWPGVGADMPRPRHRARTRALQEARGPSRGVSPQVKHSLSTTPRIAVRYPFAALPERNPYSFAQHLECF
jgi:hypothetical protein